MILRLAPIAICAVALAACGNDDGNKPAFRAGQLSATVDNPWFPFPVGRQLVYRGTEEGEPVRDVVTVTSRIKVVQGVTCRVVQDRLFVSGRLAESTLDWYAQDRAGNVWYCGEATRELDERGRVVSTEGSWQAGVAGARAGIIMPARPRPGASYQQEFYRGHAEDRATVLALGRTLRVPFGGFSNVQLTEETSPLEPSVRGRKYYARGVGLIREENVAGPQERSELVSVTPRP